MRGDVGFFGRNRKQSGHNDCIAKCPLVTQTGHQPTLRATPSSTPIRYHTCLKSRGRPRFPSPAPAYRCPLLRSLLGVKRTWVGALQMSAFDPKRTSASVSSVVAMLSGLTKCLYAPMPSVGLGDWYEATGISWCFGCWCGVGNGRARAAIGPDTSRWRADVRLRN